MFRTAYIGTRVVTPSVSSGAGETTLAFQLNNGDTYWILDTGNFRPNNDNGMDVGAPATRARTGYFGTSMVTPLVGPITDVVFNLQVNNAARWSFRASSENYDALPTADNTQSIGSPANRIAKVFTPIIDSGTIGALSLKTNNGTTQVEIEHSVNAVNWLGIGGSATGNPAFIFARGAESNVKLQLGSKGTSSIEFQTGGPTIELEILHTASATSHATITGAASAGTVGATINTSDARSLAITPAVVLASTLNFSTAAGKIIPGATSISHRNNADNADNLLIDNAGAVTIRDVLTVLGTAVRIGANPAQGSGLGLSYQSGVRERNQANDGDVNIATATTVNSVTNVVLLGIGGSSVGTQFKARSGGAAPTSSDLASGEWSLWRDTGGGTTKLYYNNAGAIQSVALA
jgi:hypothetical protein